MIDPVGGVIGDVKVVMGAVGVVIGDEAVGKTAMIVSYLSNGYPEDYNPTVHDCYSGKNA